MNLFQILLQDNKYKINPITADYLMLRSNPLTVKMVCGDVRYYDPVMEGAEAVTMIELYAHQVLTLFNLMDNKTVGMSILL